MASEHNRLLKLANDIQVAVASLQPANPAGTLEVLAALKRLQRAVEPVQSALSRQRFHTIENICVVIGLETGLLANLAAHPDEKKSAADLAQATGFDEIFISRIMRMLAGIEFVDETGYKEWTANQSTIDQVTPGGAGAVVLSNDMVFKLGESVHEFLKQHKPCRIEDTPALFDFAMGQDVWKILASRPAWKKSFDANMTMRNKIISTPWHIKYPAHDRLTSHRATVPNLPTKPTVVDIGGNQGVDLQRFAETFPQLDCRLVLQDLPETVKGITEELDPRIEVQAYDFFTEQMIKDADIYYLKSVLHDWDDTQGVRILSIAAKAMNSHSRLLINEIVLKDTNEALVKADMDILMYFLCNGMERTETQWRELLEGTQPPLKVVRIHLAPGDQQSVIESAPANV